MGRRSRKEIAESLRARLSNSRLVSAELVVTDPDGREVIRAGGVWDGRRQCYVEPPADFEHRPLFVALQPDQVAVFEGDGNRFSGFAGFIRAVREGQKKRPRLVIVGGKPGGGKTFVGMLFLQLLALDNPGDGEIAVTVLNTDNRRECIRDLNQTGLPGWIEAESSDGETRNPYRQWITGVRLSWVSARNPKKLRQRGIPWLAVVMNEAQLQPESLYATAQLAPRSRAGAVVMLMNPPVDRGGNWSTRLWHGIRDGEQAGEIFELDNARNRFIDQDFMREAGALVALASPQLARAEVDGLMAAAGPIAFPSFDGRLYNHNNPADGGCVGEPAALGWHDITREVTAEDFGEEIGADLVIGTDFQKRPGVIGDVGRYYRIPAPPGGCVLCGGGRSKQPAKWCRVLYIHRQIAVRGTEVAFSQALYNAGYTSTGTRADGTRGPRVLLIGDGTGARQNAAHDQKRTGGTTSFQAMRADGWIIRGPDVHWRHGIPWNPEVPDSLAQMFVLFESRHILLHPSLREAHNGFPSLVDSFRNAQKTSRGKLDDEGDMQHGPDGVRYLAWYGLARPVVEEVDQTLDAGTFNALAALQPTASRE